MLDIAAYRPRPMFDPAGTILYRLIGAGFALSLLAMAALGFTLSREAMAVVGIWPVVLAGGLAARRAGWDRVAGVLEGLALTYLQGVSLLLLLYAGAALGGPFADATLAGWDRALGLDWPAYFEASRPFHDWLIPIYRSFLWQPVIVVLALAGTRRMWTFLTAELVAAMLCVVIFPFFPAQGAFAHYGMGDAPYAATVEFTVALDYLREGGRHISPAMMTGLVSFPSFHTTEALLYAWAVWPTRLRWPMLALNLLVLLSVPVIGNHYFIDMAGGAAIGLAGLWVARRWAGGRWPRRGRDGLPARGGALA